MATDRESGSCFTITKPIRLYLNLHGIAGTKSVTFPPSFPAAPGRPWSPGGPGGPGCPLSPLGPVPPVGPCGKHETTRKYPVTLHPTQDRLQAEEITLMNKCYVLFLPLLNGVILRLGILPSPLTGTVTSSPYLYPASFILITFQTRQRHWREAANCQRAVSLPVVQPPLQVLVVRFFLGNPWEKGRCSSLTGICVNVL